MNTNKLEENLISINELNQSIIDIRDEILLLFETIEKYKKANNLNENGDFTIITDQDCNNVKERLKILNEKVDVYITQNTNETNKITISKEEFEKLDLQLQIKVAEKIGCKQLLSTEFYTEANNLLMNCREMIRVNGFLF